MLNKVLKILLLCMYIPGCAIAGLSVNGTAGAIDTPSADVLRPGQFLYSSFYLEDRMKFALGAAIAPRLELSGVQPSDEAMQYGIKYALREEGILTPGIAVGIRDLGDLDERSAYVVASKGLTDGYRLHAGVGSGVYNGAFLSIEKQLTLIFPVSTLVVEYNGRHMNYGIHTVLGQNMMIKYGWRGGKPFAGLLYYR